MGDVRVDWSRPLPSVPSSVTVLREPGGRYYVSFVVEREAAPLPACGREIGIDLGLASLAVTSDGQMRPLGVREWACAACGTVHDRDVNAAKNILAAGRADKPDACAAGARPHHGAAGAEAGTHRSAA